MQHRDQASLQPIGASRRALRHLTVAAGILLSILLAVPAAAHNETAAPTLRPDVLRAWHEPEVVVPGETWHGYLQFTPESNVSSAYFQVCRVGQACFGPPAAAESMGNNTYRFSSERAGGDFPVEFGPLWRVGVRWHLFEDTNLTPIPFPPAPSCPEEFLSCQEQHYLAFDMADAPPDTGFLGLPTPPAAALAICLLGVAAAVRRRMPHG